MEDILTDHEEFQDSHNESSCMDLSLIGKGKEFRKLNSYIASLVVLLIMISQSTLSILVLLGIIKIQVNIDPIKSLHFMPFHLLLVLQSFCWLLAAILDRTVHYLCGKHKKQGYVSFYTNTKFLRRIPGYVMSAGCSLSLLIAGLWGDIYPSWNRLTPQQLMVVISFTQTVIIVPSILHYVVVVVSFNKKRPLPDMETYLNESNVPMQIQVGVTRSQQELEVTIDKQAEIIQSLQHHNQVLARRIMSLHKQIKV